MPAANNRNENGVGFVEEPLLPSSHVDHRALQLQKIQSEGGTVIYVGRDEKIMLDKALKDMQSSRSVVHPTSYVETLIHLLKGNIGGGIFAMGDAFKNAGLLAGTIMTIFLGAICINCNHLLANCAQVIRIKRKLLDDPTFPETVEMCFEDGPHCFRRWTPYVRLSVKAFILITQLGFCCVYFVFVSSTAQLATYHRFILLSHFDSTPAASRAPTRGSLQPVPSDFATCMSCHLASHREKQDYI